MLIGKDLLAAVVLCGLIPGQRLIHVKALVLLCLAVYTFCLTVLLCQVLLATLSRLNMQLIFTLPIC